MNPNKVRDCESCVHSVKNTPSNAGKDWADLPCGTCEPFNPQWEEPVKAQVHLVEMRNERTHGTGPIDMGIREMPTDEAEAIERMLRWGCPIEVVKLLDAMMGYTVTEVTALYKLRLFLTSNELLAFSYLIKSEYKMTQAEIGEQMGVTKQEVNHLLKAIEKKAPSLARIVRPNRKGQ